MINYKLSQKKYCKNPKKGYFSPISLISKPIPQKHVYIFLSHSDNRIEILFEENIKDFIKEDCYELIGQKACTRREFELMKNTLREFGYHNNFNSKSYNYSRHLIINLSSLGYTTTLSKKIIKRESF